MTKRQADRAVSIRETLIFGVEKPYLGEADWWGKGDSVPFHKIWRQMPDENELPRRRAAGNQTLVRLWRIEKDKSLGKVVKKLEVELAKFKT